MDKVLIKKNDEGSVMSPLFKGLVLISFKGKWNWLNWFFKHVRLCGKGINNV